MIRRHRSARWTPRRARAARRRARRPRGRDGRAASPSRASPASARRGCSPSCAPRAEARGLSCCRARPPSSSATCRTASGSTRSTPTSRRSELDGDAAALAAVLPSLRSPTGTAATSGHRAHRAVRAAARRCSPSRQPLVLVLDDLHWSDAASIELIAGAPAPRHGARACCSRSATAPGRRRRGCARRSRRPRSRSSSWARSARTSAATLAGAELAGAGTPRSSRESGGNPFYALQLARAAALPAPSSSSDRMAEDAHVPQTVAAALADELDALAPDARRLLDAGSIAGDPFEPSSPARSRRCPRRRDDRARRAAPRRPPPAHRRTAPLRLPPPARAARRVRVDRAAAGGSPPTRGRRARLRLAARRPHRARITSSSRRPRGTPRRSSSCSRRGRRQRRAHRPRRLAGSAPRSGCCRRPTTRSGCARRSASRRRSARPATSSAAWRLCWRRWSSCRPPTTGSG